MSENGNIHPNPSVWYKHRRRLAYIAVVWAILKFIGLVWLSMASPEAVQAMSTAIGWSYGLCSTIIISYFTNTGISEYKQSGTGISIKGDEK